MDTEPRNDEQAHPKPRLRRFQDLMRFRVQNILLVSSLYDSFILAEDGQLNEALLHEYLELNLSENPDLTRVSTGAEALEIARTRGGFDLIISTLRVGDMDVAELARRVQAESLDIPVVVLAYNDRELTDFVANKDLSALERIFLWQGDVRVLLAMVKYVEDRRNVANDSGMFGVPVIIVVEDNIRFYSSFLPVIYSELLNHTHNLIQEGRNLAQKMMRIRARPKVLLCSNYEEAWSYFKIYEEQVQGIISDIQFPRRGKLDKQAGLDLIARIRQRQRDIPVVLQSSIPKNEKLARSEGASFLLKDSPILLRQLRFVLKEHFGFGDFVFCSPEGKEIDRAHDLDTLIEKLQSVPDESLAFHGERNHFSNWLKARTEFALAEALRPRKVTDFPSIDALRQEMVRGISEYRHEWDKVIVADFDSTRYDPWISIARIGGGSLGGKARGLAFVNRLLNESEIEARFPDVHIFVPNAVVLGTDVFDEFIDRNDLRDFAMSSASDTEIEKRFLMASFPHEAMADLSVYLQHVSYPVAVRSSGLLEDSPNQPFAGVYKTFMLPNNDPAHEVRLAQLITAVKRVYASTFCAVAKQLLRITPYRLEEEKMAVIIQKLVGAKHGPRFYPNFSGVSRSHNFYPTEPLKAEDGVVAVALGMGKTVVDGGNSLRFCPRHPRHVVTQSSVSNILNSSQREFYALDLSRVPTEDPAEEGSELTRYALDASEEDGTLAALGSTYSHDNNVVNDGISRHGVRLVTFAPILKHGLFPLPELLDELLKLGTRGCSAPVEVEFAVNMSVPRGEPVEFGFLQMRPLAISRELEELKFDSVLSTDLVCRSSNVLGNGKLSDIYDIVVVDYHRFDRAKSHDVALVLSRFNASLQGEGRPYVLIGVGRLGSIDPFLGIPVAWSQIAGAQVIVEAGFKDFHVTPSQGTHFFQNITSCNVGYFTVNPEAGEGYIDWDWLALQPAMAEQDCVRHLRFDTPLVVKMSGQTGEGVILKPA